MIQVSHLVLKNEWRIWEETSLDAFDFPPHLSQRSSQIDWRDKLASMYLYNKLPLNGWVPLSGVCLGGASRASGWTVSHEGPLHIRGNNLMCKMTRCKRNWVHLHREDWRRRILLPHLWFWTCQTTQKDWLFPGIRTVESLQAATVVGIGYAMVHLVIQNPLPGLLQRQFVLGLKG